MARLFALTAVLAVASAGVSSNPMFLATDSDTGAVVLCRPVGEKVTLAYTHSMYGGEVREEFVGGRDGRLRRLAMTTANAAAAEYYAYDVGVERDGDRFRVDVPIQAFPEVAVRVDDVGAHRLLVDDVSIDLVAATGNGHRLVFSVGPVPFVARLPPGGC